MQPLTTAQQELYDWLVDYIQENQHSPSIRQMMRAMGLKSPAPIQSRLEHLRTKEYIDWTEGRARTIRLLESVHLGVPLQGEIAAGGLIEPFTDEAERLNLGGFALRPQDYALRVTGDSMVDAMIMQDDIVIMRPVPEPDRLKNGVIVAARVEGHGNTLKYFYRDKGNVTLKAANANYQPIQVTSEQVMVQGRLIGVWRDYQ
ncbi:MAG: transcriptional repressor LexA [Elainellaceae cyanobacterium]